MQSVLDCHSRHGWGRLYTTKLPVTTVPVLNQDGRLTNHLWQENYQVITVSVHSDTHA